MKKRTFYQAVSSAFQAMRNCEAAGNATMSDEWFDYLAWLVKEYAPTGRGFDAGVEFDDEASIPGKKLVFRAAFHHMSEHGYYDGWTEHKVTVIPTFDGIDIARVSGRNKRDIKDYIGDTFAALADIEVPNLAEWRKLTAGKAA